MNRISHPVGGNYASTLTVELNYAPNKNTKFLQIQLHKVKIFKRNLTGFNTECSFSNSCCYIKIKDISQPTIPIIGGACGVMVIVVGNGHSDTSSNPERVSWHFFHNNNTLGKDIKPIIIPPAIEKQ